jgi:hypothetical protein
VHTSLYLPEALYEGLREAAFRERRKINEIVVEGVEIVLRKRRRRDGGPGLARLGTSRMGVG